MDNCQQFDGFRIAYRLEVPDKNASADAPSCHSAVSIAQAPGEMWGLLYVNDTEELRRSECQDLQYLVVAKEQHTQLETSMQIQIILDNEGEHRPSLKWFHPVKHHHLLFPVLKNSYKLVFSWVFYQSRSGEPAAAVLCGKQTPGSL